MIKVTVDTDEIYETTKTRGNVVVTISDNGIGIPPEKQHMLFSKFAELNNKANKETQNVSSGLGLYITKGIIDAHNGTIKIDCLNLESVGLYYYMPVFRDIEGLPLDLRRIIEGAIIDSTNQQMIQRVLNVSSKNMEVMAKINPFLKWEQKVPEKTKEEERLQS